MPSGDTPYRARTFRTPAAGTPSQPTDPGDDSAIREAAQRLADQVSDAVAEATRRAASMNSAVQNGDFHVAVLTELARLTATMATLPRIEATVEGLRSKQERILIRIESNDGRANGLEQKIDFVGAQVSAVDGLVRSVDERLGKVEHGTSSGLQKVIAEAAHARSRREQAQADPKTKTWLSGAKALGVIIVAVGTAIAAVVTVIIHAQTTPSAPVERSVPPPANDKPVPIVQGPLH